MSGSLRPTFALLLPPLAWFLLQQGLSVAMRTWCGAGGPPFGPLCGAGSLMVCIFAVWLAWPDARQVPAEAAQVRHFLALLALIGAGMFALAIGFQTFATLAIPPCAA
jgi:hypothetical protein